MFTEESSQQITPLPEDHAEPEPPQLRPSEPLQSPVQKSWISAWLDVSISFGVWIASIFALLIVPVVYAIPYLVFRIAKFGPPTPEALSTDKGLIFFSVAGVLPTHMLTIVFVWLVVT